MKEELFKKDGVEKALEMIEKPHFEADKVFVVNCVMVNELGEDIHTWVEAYKTMSGAKKRLHNLAVSHPYLTGKKILKKRFNSDETICAIIFNDKSRCVFNIEGCFINK